MSDSPSILISINAAWNIYNFRKSLIERLKDEGFTVISAAPDDAYSERLRQIVDEHHHIPMSNAGASPLQDLLLFYGYVRLLKQLKPSIMLGYTIKPNVYGSFACGLLGIPIINNVSGLGTVFIKRNWVTIVAKLLYQSAFKLSSTVFFQNKDDRKLFITEKLVDSRKAELIPGSGIDLEHYKPRERATDENPSFVLIARMLWDKGVGEYVQAAALVKEHYPNVTFNLVGPIGVDNRTAIAESKIKEWDAANTIHYLGETDDVRSVIAENSAVVLPSYREGMSRVLLEGLAMGRPLIATNVPGCKHTIDDGKNGFLCKSKDAKDLATKIIQFIELSELERVNMGNESRKKAEAEFDQEIVLNAYVKKIKSLIS